MKIQFKMFILAVMCVFLAYLWLPINDLKTAYADNDDNRSSIAGVNVEGLDRNEIIDALTNAINDWTNEDIQVKGGGIEISIDATQLQFDIESSIDEYKTLTKKPWYAFWQSARVVHIPLKIIPNEQIKTEIAEIAAWNTDETYNQLLSQASFLKDHQVEAAVKDTSVYENERLALVIEDIPTNAFEPEELVHLLDDTMINPGEQFSLLETLDDNITKVNNESLNFVASLLYSAVLQTEFEILERHHQEESPTYLSLGNDAKLNVALNEDLKFLNNTDYVAKINVSKEGRTMKLEITSNTKENEVFVHVEKERLSPRIIYRYSNDLPLGYEQVLQEGSEGYRVIVTRTISRDGSTEEQRVSRDYYPPVNEIVLKSSKEPETTEGSDTSTDETVPNQPDPNMDIDLDGDGLPDIEVPVEDKTPPVYDKGGNVVTP